MNKFSIIIHVSDSDKNVAGCVESLVSQTYADIEIILVYDNLSDKGCDRLSFNDTRIGVISTETPGVCSARNAAIAHATGDYIIFADANSIFESSIIEKCAAEISAHSPDLLVCAIASSADDGRSKIYIDSNMYTRFEYTENIARYISTGIGFSTVANKVFSSHIIKSRNLHFSEEMPLVADEVFNCRYFTIAGHIRCIPDLLCISGTAVKPVAEGTTEYLAQGKEYSQKLIDAVQSKGLYNIASQAIIENYQRILYRHLVLLASCGSSISQQQIAALEKLAQSSDYGPLMMYLSSLRGIKNQCIYNLFKLRQWRLLITFLRK